MKLLCNKLRYRVIKLSVIITNYNNQEYLNECLFEIAKVHNDFVEVLLLDDCSTDESLQIANRYLTKIKNFKIIRINLNRGVSYCRNMGIRESTGEFFTFVDSDDVIYLERITIDINNAFTKDYDWIIYSYSSNFSIFSEEEKMINYKEYSNESFIRSPFKDKLYYSMVWGKLYKKSVFSNINFIENVRFEDEAYSLNVMITSKKILLIDRVIYYYRRHKDSFMGESLFLKLDYKRVLDLDVVLRQSISIVENSQLRLSDRELIGLYLLKNLLFMKFNIYANKMKSSFDNLTYLSSDFGIIFFYERIINLLPEILFTTIYKNITKLISTRMK